MVSLKKRNGHLLRTGPAGSGHLVRLCIGRTCTDYTCSSYIDSIYGHTVQVSNGVDLSVIECRDFDTGAIRLIDYSFVVNIVGTAVGVGEFMEAGGTGYPLTDVDVTGSYDFSVAYTSPFPGGLEYTVTPEKYIVSDQFLTRLAGIDYYARIEVSGTYVFSKLVTTRPHESEKRVRYGHYAFATMCSQECLCKTFKITGGSTEIPGSVTEGHILDGLTFSGNQTS